MPPTAKFTVYNRDGTPVWTAGTHIPALDLDGKKTPVTVVPGTAMAEQLALDDPDR